MTPSMADAIRAEDEQEDLLTRPGAELFTFMQPLRGRMLVLEAGGKMGPTLAVLARRAADAGKHPLEVLAASRFSNDATRRWLEARGVQTLRLDLLEREAVARLPDASHVLYLVGFKLVSAQNPAQTWAVNALIPAHVAERYPRATVVALSTGNVYPLVPAPGPGSIETDQLTPFGEYANAAVARERGGGVDRAGEACGRGHGGACERRASACARSASAHG